MSKTLPQAIGSLAMAVDKLLRPLQPLVHPLARADVPTVKECWDMYAGSFNDPR